ncbi:MULTISPECIES: pilus assembly protein TadG-related protein [Microbacterium]|uniref:pilus assembly protein TadG-related protein n=1 Tax=Microbacterium TaxID=33882 RepID=UPI0010F59275|nr:pilus assembly protein TadG-related protein [Microbacterium sp. 4NA327F11]MCK9916945.1 hypothetical protein [Microbacteriaceae bacterium K1510]
MTARCAHDDEGSILPLVLGYGMLAIALVLVCAEATGLFLAQKRLDGVADAAAVAAASSYDIRLEGEGAVIVLRGEDITSGAERALAATGADAVLVDAVTDDGRSARVRVTSTWRSVLLSPFVPAGVDLTSTATSRVALR